MQSTPNSQSSHNCPFRRSQTKMCCWIQVSFSSQIKILCDLHNLFNTDPHSDPSFTFPFFCQQQNISSLKTDLQPRQMIRELGQKRDKVQGISDPEGGSLKLSLWCDSEAQQSCGKSVTKWLSMAKISKIWKEDTRKAEQKGLEKVELCGQIKPQLIHHSSCVCLVFYCAFQIMCKSKSGFQEIFHNTVEFYKDYFIYLISALSLCSTFSLQPGKTRGLQEAHLFSMKTSCKGYYFYSL